jgi:16S rRNA (guanine527-N7)-methyltransferase
VPDDLDEILRQAQDLGMLGPGALAEHRRHAEELSQLALRGLEPERPLEFLDLGSGGGLPGLVLARALPDSDHLAGALLDSQRRRAAFLQEAVDRLGLAERIQIVLARAEDAAREVAHRERYTLVVARAFGPPAVTAECAVAFLRPGGRLVVSEPPESDPTRWDTDQLAALGLSPPELVASAHAHAAVLHRQGDLAPRWPRKRGIPQKRPLWEPVPRET